MRNNRCSMAPLDEIDCDSWPHCRSAATPRTSSWRAPRGSRLPATSRRVQRLREDGVIEAIRAVVVPEQVGLGIEAYVLISLAEHTPEADARFAREVSAMPNVLRADGIAGADDALVHVAVATAGDLQRLLLALKRAGASRATTMLRLQAIEPPAPVPARQ